MRRRVSKRRGLVHFSASLVLALGGCLPRAVVEHPDVAGTTEETLVHAGDERTYRLHRGQGPIDGLVVVLHGGGSTAASMEETTGWSAIADREGLVVAYPEGTGFFGWGQMWNAGDCCGRPHVEGIDDAGFVAALVRTLAARFRVPRRRVLLVGYSNGALLALDVGIARGEDIGGVAAYAGSLRAAGPVAAPVFEAGPLRATSLLVAHATGDPRVPHAGRDLGAEVDVAGPRLARFWAVAAGCSGDARTHVSRGGALVTEEYADCPEGSRVGALTIAGWDHEWPGAAATRALLEGDPLRGFDLAETMWAFFFGPGGLATGGRRPHDRVE